MRFLTALAVAGLLSGAAACTSAVSPRGQGATTHAGGGPLSPARIGDAEFAASAYQILLDGERSPKRAELLAGVVRHQLERAGRRFAAGNREAGLRALTGALFLMRVGELRPEMIERAAPALRAGAAEVSRVGNEGRALALYGMLRGVVPPGPEQADVNGHLAALTRWSATTQRNGPMQSLGSLQRAAVDRAVFDPSPQALESAHKTTVTWIQRALEFNASEMPRSRFEREEAVEAYRAIRAGGATLVALYLRHGDPAGALSALEQADLLRVVPPGLTERLERAQDDDDPAAWADLYKLFTSTESSARPETSLDADLARAAGFGVAIELFRSEPRSLRGSAALASELTEHGMAEVAPAVLSPALGERPSAQDLSWALALVLRGMISEDELGDHSSARRTFQHARRLIDLADAKQLAGRVRPSAGRLYYVMGALETRAGELRRARPLIEAAAKREPSVQAFSVLAAIDRQRGATKAALAALDRVRALAKQQADLAEQAEALLTVFEIHRDAGHGSEAKKALLDALKIALDARQAAKALPQQARAERLLARVLDQFGAEQPARRATERAYQASRSDLRQLTATVLDASRRALTRGDLAAARDAVRQAMEASLPDEDLVYVALWLHLLQKRLNATGDGTSEEALASIDDDSGWPAKLAAWARGKLSDEGLLKAARSRVQATEAKFYTAMAKRGQGEPEAMLPKLREVAQSEAIELVEVTIARDLIAQHGARLDLQLPTSVAVP
jgi:cellulose synthase operon protein C